MLGRLQLYGLIAIAFVAGLLGIYVSGVQSGIDRAKRKIDEKRLDNFATAKEVNDEVQVLDDSSLSDRADKWVRSKDKR
jgi:hypothetical protein